MAKFFQFEATEKAEHIKQFVPPHAQEALELYIVEGIKPGGFLEACLAGDLFRAAKIADTRAQSHSIQLTWEPVIRLTKSHQANK